MEEPIPETFRDTLLHVAQHLEYAHSELTKELGGNARLHTAGTCATCYWLTALNQWIARRAGEGEK